MPPCLAGEVGGVGEGHATVVIARGSVPRRLSGVLRGPIAFRRIPCLSGVHVVAQGPTTPSLPAKIVSVIVAKTTAIIAEVSIAFLLRACDTQQTYPLFAEFLGHSRLSRGHRDSIRETGKI